MVQKFSESVHGHFEDFLVTECLVGDICKERHEAQSNRNTDLIRSKLVHNSKHKVLKRTYTKSQNHVNSAKHVSNKYLT